MKVTIAGKELKIYWRYCISEMTLKRITTCYITDSSGEDIGVGNSACHRKDNFCKEIGRRISLGRALKVVEFECVYDDGIHNRNLNKSERHKVLEAYHGRKKAKETVL